MTRKDPVTPELRIALFERDGSCIAPLVGGSANDCFGRSTIEHVKSDLRMGVRAASDLEHCVVLCEGHSENGRRAGYQWNTAKPNRDAVREYLASVR